MSIIVDVTLQGRFKTSKLPVRHLCVSLLEFSGVAFVPDLDRVGQETEPPRGVVSPDGGQDPPVEVLYSAPPPGPGALRGREEEPEG